MSQQPQQAGQPADLLIRGNELVHLNKMIEQMPTLYGFPLIQFFSQVSALRNQEAQVAKEKAPVDPAGPKESKKEKSK